MLELNNELNETINKANSMFLRKTMIIKELEKKNKNLRIKVKNLEIRLKKYEPDYKKKKKKKKKKEEKNTEENV